MATRLAYSIIFLFGLGLVQSGTADADLVGWWKLDGNATDSSGGGHDGVLYGGPLWDAGIIGGALTFDGADDRVEMPGTSGADGFAGLAGEVTWTMWMKTSPRGAIQTIMGIGPAGAAHVQGNRSINVETSGVIMVRAHTVGALTSLSSTATVDDDQWHHIAITLAFDTDGANDTMKVYIDGDLSKGYEADDVNVNQYAGPAANFVVTLGARAGSPFGGSLDDVRIYDRALSDDEIRVLFESSGEPYPFAYGPAPRNDSMLEETYTRLRWMPGDFAAAHNVYFGTSFEDVNTATPESQGVFVGSATDSSQLVGVPEALVPGTTYYWRVDEVNDVNPDSPWRGEVWSFWVRPVVAWDPSPADGLMYVNPEQSLSWQSGLGNLFHTVYFGESFDEVSNAPAGGIMTVEAVYDPALEAGKTYFWRVDEFDGPRTYKGDVWSFTTVPEVAITDPSLAVWWTLDEGEGNSAVDWSGHGHHGAVHGEAQWVDGYQGTALAFADDVYVEAGGYPGVTGTEPRTVCAWIRTTTPNRTIMSWGVNVAGEKWRMRADATGGLRVEVSGGYHYGVTNIADGQWHHVAVTFEDDGSPDVLDTLLYVDGQAEAAADSLDEPIDTAATGAVRIGESPWHNAAFVGEIDDARIYDKVLTEEEIRVVMRGNPLLAGDPAPARDAIVDIRTADSLSWSAGDTAASHDVYFGTDRGGLELQANQAGTSFSLAGLVAFGGGDYFWRIDEIDSDGTVQSGDIWTFTIPSYLIVDDFESYTDAEGERIYETWIDGWTNGTGSVVGYLEAPFAERSIVSSGTQSMPLEYDNAASPYYSEAERAWTTAQDWTVSGVDTLVVDVRGTADNGAGRLYVVLEDSAGNTAISVHPDPDAVTAANWTEWPVPLSDFAGVDASRIEKLIIGVGDRNAPAAGGAGQIYIDGIRLIRGAPASQ